MIAMAILLLALHTLAYLVLGAILALVLPDEFGERRLRLGAFRFHDLANALNVHANAVSSRDDDTEASVASGDNDNEGDGNDGNDSMLLLKSIKPILHCGLLLS